MSTQVLSFPPLSLNEMTAAITAVAEKKAFFGRDLFVLSQEHNDQETRFLRAEMVVADIANRFLECCG